jgi:hypothetical protein
LLLHSASLPLPSPHTQQHHSIDIINTTPSACIDHQPHHHDHLPSCARSLTRIPCPSTAVCNAFGTSLCFTHSAVHSCLLSPHTGSPTPQVSHARWPSAARHEMLRCSPSLRHVVFAPPRHAGSPPANNHPPKLTTPPPCWRACHKAISTVSVRGTTGPRWEDRGPAKSEYPRVSFSPHGSS